MSSKKTKKASGPGTWKYVVGRRPNTLTAYERSEKGNTVWLRWNRPGTGLYEKMSLSLIIRDDQGRLDPEKVKEAQRKANEAYDRLRRGENPRDPVLQVDEEGRVRLTLADGLNMALSVPDGMYAIENEHVADMRRYKRYLLKVLPATLTWDELSEVSYETCWRKLAALKRDEGIGGQRTTELAIVLLAQTGRWLKRARHLKEAPAAPEAGYAAKLDADWHRITSEPKTEAARPRYTPAELGRLHLHVDNPGADPRIRLGFHLAGEARLGQALELCTRLQLDLRPVGAYGMGRLTIPDNGKKKGTSIDLTAAMRAATDLELNDGYLQDLESAYGAGRIKNYPLFPGGRLVRGIARVDATQPIGRRAATDLWHEFEKVAGVEIIRQRGWYGVRRTGADLAEDVEADGRALNAITGHTSDEMRRRIYQEKLREAILGKAATAREAARQVAIDAARAAAASPRVEPGQREWERKREARRARRAAAHAENRRSGSRRRSTYPPKRCAQCGIEFTPSGPNTRACSNCCPRRKRHRP